MILLVPYWKLSQREIFSIFSASAGRDRHSHRMYNNPTTSVVDMRPETVGADV
jgi:dihydrodipicolinate synthase/N-acetylneuraminate lyase